MKVILHSDWGGFSISDSALRLFAERKGWVYQVLQDKYPLFASTYAVISSAPLNSIKEWNEAKNNGIETATKYCSEYRADPILVSVIEEMHKIDMDKDFRIVEIPDDMKWYIHDYDGQETLHEEHRSW